MPTKSVLPSDMTPSMVQNDYCLSGLMNSRLGSLFSSLILLFSIIFISTQVDPNFHSHVLFLLIIPISGILGYLTDKHYFYLLAICPLSIIFITFSCAILSETVLILSNESGYHMEGREKNPLDKVVENIHETVNSLTGNTIPSSFVPLIVITIFLFLTLCTYIKSYKFTKELSVLKTESGAAVFLRETPSRTSVCHGPVINIESFDQEFNRVDRHRS